MISSRSPAKTRSFYTTDYSSWFFLATACSAAIMRMFWFFQFLVWFQSRKIRPKQQAGKTIEGINWPSRYCISERFLLKKVIKLVNLVV